MGERRYTQTPERREPQHRFSQQSWHDHSAAWIDRKPNLTIAVDHFGLQPRHGLAGTDQTQAEVKCDRAPTRVRPSCRGCHERTDDDCGDDESPLPSRVYPARFFKSASQVDDCTSSTRDADARFSHDVTHVNQSKWVTARSPDRRRVLLQRLTGIGDTRVALSTRRPVGAETAEAQSRFDSSRLLNWLFWVAISVVVIVAGFVLIGLIRYTHRGAAPNNSVAPAMPEATWVCRSEARAGLLTHRSGWAPRVDRSVPRPSSDRDLHRPALPKSLSA